MQTSIPESMLKEYRNIITKSSENGAEMIAKLMNKFTCSRKGDFAKTIRLLVNSYFWGSDVSTQKKCKIETRKTMRNTEPEWSQHWSRINPKSIDKSMRNLRSKNSIKNRALERQAVAKVTSSIRWRVDNVKFLGWRGLQDQLKIGPFGRKTIQKGSRHADGPKARRI